MAMNAVEVFKQLFNSGSQSFKSLKDFAISPESEKKLKVWGIAETAEMVDRTTQTLRNLEKRDQSFQPSSNDEGKRRAYTLKDINKLRDLYGTRPKRAPGTEPAILGFMNFKGGAGKTTTAVTAAQYFAKQGYRVLLIDCDSQGSATQMFGYIPDEDFDEDSSILKVLLRASTSLKDVIVKTYWDGLDLVPANLALYNAELTIPTMLREMPDFYTSLKLAIDKEKDNYDIVILDCPPSMGMISINAAFAANSLIVQMPPNIVDFASTIQFFKMVGEVMERLPEKNYAFIRILITKFNGRSTARQMLEFMQQFYGSYLMRNYMIESEAIAKSAASMMTLYEVDNFIGSKKTYDRAIECADRVNGEIEELIHTMWDRQILQSREVRQGVEA